MQGDPFKTKRLARSVELAFQKMEGMRRARYKMLAQYVGPFYAKNKGGAGDSEEKKASPINLMYNAVTTMVPNLVYNNPKCKITSQILPFRQYGENLGLAVNHLGKRIDLKMTLRKVITDALFCAGFVKTGLGDGGSTVVIDGVTHVVGQPFADRVDPDDMVIDPGARDWDEMAFVGNRFRLRRDDAMEGGLYDPDKLKQLSSRYQLNSGFKTEASALQGDGGLTMQSYQEIADYVDLVEIYLPAEQLIVTLPYGPGHSDSDILRVVEYEGPDKGPYHMLGFAYVPDNVLPVPPASIWYYLHILSNRIARKIGRQAERMKRLLAFEGQAEEDAQELMDADDGETVRVDHIDAVKEINLGGTTDDAYKYQAWVEEQFSKQAGNIDQLAGNSADAPTATQSQMLAANQQIRLADQQNIVYDFTADVMGDLAYFIHTDPLIELPLARRVNGVDQQVTYSPEMRDGDFFDYFLTIIPYSMARQDPNVRLKRIMDFIATNIPALAMAFQQLGPMFNLEGAVNLVLREMGIEEADELINSQLLQQHVQMMMQQWMQGGVMPDGKAATGGQPNPQAAQQGPQQQQPAFAGGVRPQQPNPMQMGPVGGVMPGQEQNMQAQETAGQLQSTYR